MWDKRTSKVTVSPQIAMNAPVHNPKKLRCTCFNPGHADLNSEVRYIKDLEHFISFLQRIIKLYIRNTLVFNI